jgi:hypothetical protein
MTPYVSGAEEPRLCAALMDSLDFELVQEVSPSLWTQLNENRAQLPHLCRTRSPKRGVEGVFGERSNRLGAEAARAALPAEYGAAATAAPRRAISEHGGGRSGS